MVPIGKQRARYSLNKMSVTINVVENIPLVLFGRFATLSRIVTKKGGDGV